MEACGGCNKGNIQDAVRSYFQCLGYNKYANVEKACALITLETSCGAIVQ